MTDFTHDHGTDNEYRARLASGLAALADAPAPASRLDTAWAIHTGRSRLRRRRTGLLGAVTAVVLGASLAGAVLPFGNPDASTAPLTGGTSALPRFGPDTGRDPMTINATFGWLPPGFEQYMYDVSPGKLSITALGPETGAGDLLRGRINLAVYPPGQEPPVPEMASTGTKWYLIETAPVNGHPAYWRGTGPDNPVGLGGQRFLRFRVPDGRWAELTESNLESAPLEEMLPRIAADVRTSRQAAALPFTLRDLPSAYALNSANFDVGLESAAGFPWMASLTYVLDHTYVTVVARPDTGRDPKQDPNPPQPGAEVTPSGACKSQRGLRLCVGSPQGDDALAATGGPQGWLDRVTGLGADPADWTTDVIR
ncbi:hypothetical protein ABTX81_35995 [Kitasatospora sp. NPDC097605]|uniref:hypothetical protein n=1 Tax=Kitasatospora sp. NPDC097605 TaxID=3157226 RepID=UPI00332A728E